MGTQFLDKAGLQYFWSLLKAKFSECLTKNEASSTYATKSSAVTKVKINGTEHSPTNGLVDLGTISGGGGGITQETDPVFVASPAHGITSADIANWNSKTSNTGTYSKPSGGIPKTDLASAVQTSLGKADTALQSFTETDPTVPAWAKAANPPTYTAADVGALPDTTVIPTVPSTLSAFTDDLGSSPTHTHAQYLLLLGGIISGTIKFSAANNHLVKTDNTGYLALSGGGSAWSSAGGNLILYGQNASSNAGGCVIRTVDANGNAKALTLLPDGSIKWAGKRLLTEDDLTSIENGTY